MPMETRRDLEHTIERLTEGLRCPWKWGQYPAGGDDALDAPGTVRTGRDGTDGTGRFQQVAPPAPRGGCLAAVPRTLSVCAPVCLCLYICRGGWAWIGHFFFHRP